MLQRAEHGVIVWPAGVVSLAMLAWNESVCVVQCGSKDSLAAFVHTPLRLLSRLCSSCTSPIAAVAAAAGAGLTRRLSNSVVLLCRERQAGGEGSGIVSALREAASIGLTV